jgi:uncharacterized membrane protein
VRTASLLLTVLLLSIFSSLITPANEPEIAEDDTQWQRIELSADTMKGLVGTLELSLTGEERAILADSRLGIYDQGGLLLKRDIPEELLIPRSDLSLLLISDQVHMATARTALSEVQGLVVREYISPSGLLVQGTNNALKQAKSTIGVVAGLPVPVAMVVDESLWTHPSQLLRLESWRDEGLLPGVKLEDEHGSTLHQDLHLVATAHLEELVMVDDGRYRGLFTGDLNQLSTLASEISTAWVRAEPQFSIDNNKARSHMKITGSDGIDDHFATELDGSGQIVAVADSGLDEDHGDFGTRVVGNVDVIGDGSSADLHSGHGTHVACTVLGDGTRGTYSGVAPAAELYLQAMENDNTGNFQSPSLNNLFNTAYNAGARIHTNSWGSSQASSQGKYTSESEDVDDRANYYDRYYNGVEGLTILFASGNDGPGVGTASSPATAKNSVTVGSHLNRGGGSPDTISQSSSRGPTDDNRIKPDVIAPGAYVRSCLSQDATDTSGGTVQTGGWYIEYSGTSMATPNAAGSAALIREYILEIAQRPAPQGALVKALLVLGARDLGNRDIPNNDEGWGRIDLQNTLAPSDRGIWVDDRSVLSGTGNVKTYTFNVTTSGQPFKAVLCWSDERGSRFSTNQLVNDLNLEIETPSGTLYRGNQFSQGRSIEGGTFDSTNNLEVVLIDSAESGIWTIRAKDGGHSGQKSQPFALAVSGAGVNDLRPDPMVLPNLQVGVAIPQIGEDVTLTMAIQNFGNIEAEDVEVEFLVENQSQASVEYDLGPGGLRNIAWNWQPVNSGGNTLSFIVDPDGLIEEISESNNRLDWVVNVTTPGVKLESPAPIFTLSDEGKTTTSWNVTLTNTALLATNASVTVTSVTRITDGVLMPWYVSIGEGSYSLSGSGHVDLSATMVHPELPTPGVYIVSILGTDDDNSIQYPYDLQFVVPILGAVRFESAYTTIPIDPRTGSSIDFIFHNDGNGDVGYDLFLLSPVGWSSGFDDLSSEGGASSGSTGLILENSMRQLSITFTPPLVMLKAGAEYSATFRAITQTENPQTFDFEIPLVVMEIKQIDIYMSTTIGEITPGTGFSLLFSFENNGNLNHNITPTLTLPSGWTQISQLITFDLYWTQSHEILINIYAGDTARSGQIALFLTSGQDSWSWVQEVTIEKLAVIDVQFARLEIGDERWDSVMGPGSHPTSERMTFTWIITNDADNIWSPEIDLTMDDDLIGECEPMDDVSNSDEVLLVCTMIIDSDATPGTEPKFTVSMSDGSSNHQFNITLFVAFERSVEWDVVGPSQFNVGESTSIDVRIVNTGNTRLTHTLQFAGPKGWQISSDNADFIFDLEAGQSDSIELSVLASQAGEGELLLWLSNADDVEASSHSLPIASMGVINDDSSSESETSNIIGVIGLLVIAFLVGLVIIQLRSKFSSKDQSQQQYSQMSLNSSIDGPVKPANNAQGQQLKEYQEQAEKYAQYQVELAEYEQKMQQYEGPDNQSAEGTEETAENNESGADYGTDEPLIDSDGS